MRAGRLRHRLVLQSKVNASPARDEYGSALLNWSTQATVWGAIEPLYGNELFAQQQMQSETRVRVTLRYYSGLDTSWRIKHNDPATSPETATYYDIVDIIDKDARHAMMTLMCRVGVSEDT